jgi:hypothetical protein
MSVNISKINELIDYLNGYKQRIILEENCEKEFTMLSQSLWVLGFGLENINQTKAFPEAGVILQTDVIIRYLDTLEIPKTAIITNRIFQSVVKKELQTCIGFQNVMPLPHAAYVLDHKTQALNYETLAAGSFDPKFIEQNLLCSLSHLYSIKDDSALPDIERIESLIKVLRTPLKLGYAFRYLFAGFRTHSVPFSIHHPRFIDILTDLSLFVNAVPMEKIMGERIMHWVNAVKEHRI